MQTVELAVAAEELGDDGAFVRTHRFAPQLASPFPLLAAIAARTRRIELGTGVIDMRWHIGFMTLEPLPQVQQYICLSVCTDIISVMRILIVGQGPVATVLATSFEPHVQLALAVREPEGEYRTVQSRRVRAGSRGITSRRVELMSLPSVPMGWDAVVSTAAPDAPGMRDLLTRVDAGVVMAVSQVPSEVAVLAKLAGERPWGIVVPGFLAWGTGPVSYWRTGSLFTVAGSASPILRGTFDRALPEASVAIALLQAATTMPIVAGLHSVGYDLARAAPLSRRLARAADEARSAVAADYDLPTPRRVLPAAVRAALWGFPRLAPMNLTDYLSAHFGGHRMQTVRMLTDWITSGRSHGLATIELEELRKQLGGEKWWSMH
ncbi:LLM class flavin-dependent oxidoreductase [Luethyella okanaganae]|uniref:LLM class flavin-dependent oxidoreductase n=1 Tax=Luethyella okanaganae TaxID=69372 RepID=A0ABW1VFT4_9MICO